MIVFSPKEQSDLNLHCFHLSHCRSIFSVNLLSPMHGRQYLHKQMLAGYLLSHLTMLSSEYNCDVSFPMYCYWPDFARCRLELEVRTRSLSADFVFISLSIDFSDNGWFSESMNTSVTNAFEWLSFLSSPFGLRL